MSTFALLLVALVVGWLATLSLVRDVHRLELADFLIAAAGACSWAFLVAPLVGTSVWGDNGLRLSATLEMAVAATGMLVLANLVRGRGVRAGKLDFQATGLSQVARYTVS